MDWLGDGFAYHPTRLIRAYLDNLAPLNYRNGDTTIQVFAYNPTRGVFQHAFKARFRKFEIYFAGHN